MPRQEERFPFKIFELFLKPTDEQRIVLPLNRFLNLSSIGEEAGLQ